MNRISVVIAVFLAIVTICTNLTCFGQLPGQGPGPLADELKYVVIYDSSAAVAALEAGEIDVTDIDNLADLERVQNEGFKIVQLPTFGVLGAFLACDQKPTSDVNFRLAIAHLVPKEAVQAELWGPLAIYEHNIVPFTFGWLYNPNVPDLTTYDPALAELILDNAGYVKGPDGWRRDPETGEILPEVKLVYCPDLYGAPGLAYLERWRDNMIAVGIPAKIETVNFAGGAWYQKIMVDRDFHAFMIGHGTRPGPRWFEIFYSSWGYLNIMKWYNTTFDDLCTRFKSTINQTEAQELAWRMQEIAVYEMPTVVFHVNVATFAYNPDLIFLQEPYAAYSSISLRWRWRSGPGGTIRIRVADEPEHFIHAWDAHGIVFTYTRYACDVAIDSQPKTGEAIPWIISKWKIDPWTNEELNVTNGMKITLWVADNIYWHDGVKFTAYDIEFTAKYAYDTMLRMGEGNPPRLIALVDKLVDAVALNETVVELYYNKTSLFTLSEAFQYPYVTSYPKHLYNPNATRYGPPEGPMGLQYEGQPGVPEPEKFKAPFVPYPNPPPDKPWLTCFIGPGPWILKSYEWGVGATFVANRDYFLTPLITDLNFDRKVNIKDIFMAAIAFNSNPEDPRWEPLADLDGNDVIDTDDITQIIADFGKKY